MSLSRSDRFHHHKIASLSLPWIVRFFVSIISAVVDNACRSNGTANRRLVHFLDYQINPPKSTNESDSISSSDISVDPSRNLWFRLYSPSTSNNQPLPVLIFFHGGGFSFLSPASLAYDIVCRNFAFKLPAIVISVNYRLAPEHRYPSQYEDGLDVLKFIDKNNASVLPINADPLRCFFAGDSAGANLAHHVAVRACRTELRTLKVIGMISIQPFFGGEERTESEKQLVAGPLLVSLPRTDWCWKAFLPEGSNRDHPASNVSGPNSTDISSLNFPATMVVIGGFDPLKDWQRRYYDWLRKLGKMAILIEYPSMIHAFYVFPNLPEASNLVIQIKNFIAKCSSSQVSNSVSATSEAPTQVSPRYLNLFKIYLGYFQLYIGLLICMFGLLFGFLYKM